MSAQHGDWPGVVRCENGEAFNFCSKLLRGLKAKEFSAIYVYIPIYNRVYIIKPHRGHRIPVNDPLTSPKMKVFYL